MEVREIEPLLLTIEEAAKVLGVSARQGYYLANAKVIPTVRLGHKRRVPVDLLREVVARLNPA